MQSNHQSHDSIPSDLPSIASQTPSQSTQELQQHLQNINKLDNKRTQNEQEFLVQESLQWCKTQTPGDDFQGKALSRGIEMVIQQAQMRIGRLDSQASAEPKRKGNRGKKQTRLTLQQTEALEDCYEMIRCMPDSSEIEEIARLLGLVKRKVYKWFWKRHKKDKEDRQLEAGTGGAAVPEQDLGNEDTEGLGTALAAKMEKQAKQLQSIELWADDFNQLAGELGIDVEKAATELIDLPSPQQSRIVFKLNLALKTDQLQAAETPFNLALQSDQIQEAETPNLLELHGPFKLSQSSHADSESQPEKSQKGGSIFRSVQIKRQVRFMRKLRARSKVFKAQTAQAMGPGAGRRLTLSKMKMSRLMGNFCSNIRHQRELTQALQLHNQRFTVDQAEVSTRKSERNQSEIGELLSLASSDEERCSIFTKMLFTTISE